MNIEEIEVLPRPYSVVTPTYLEPVYHPQQIRNDELADEIAELSAQLQSADYRLLVLIREFDENGGWAQQGCKTCAHWLSWRIGLNAGAAREKIRVARALANLPLISEAMEKGEISYSKARAVTRVATPANEKQLLTIALGGTAGQVERIVRGWRKIDLQEEKAHVDYQQEHASVTTYTDDDGMLVIKGRLPSEIGAVFVKALEAASDKLYKDDNELPHERRRAEAMKVIAEAALNAELDPGTSADRYQVVVHIDQAVLENPENDGQSTLEGGIGVSAETSRRIACDASIVEMVHDQKGNILDVGRKTRKISPALRRALDARDPTCIWPGCDCTYVQGHHLKFWGDDGETKLWNLANLCNWHHHLVHDDGFKVELLDNGKTRVTHPGGWVIPEVPPPSRLPDKPLAELALELEGWEGKPKWGYAPIDLTLVLETMWQPGVGEDENEPPDT